MVRSHRTASNHAGAAPEHIDALSFSALRSLAENPEASPQTLALLSYDPETEVQMAVAWNPRTPATALARLAAGAPEVQAGVAQNPSSPPDVLDRLAGSPDALIRSAAAVNACLPLPILERLASDPDPQVRRQVARSCRAPFHLLARLAQDPDPRVRSTAEVEVLAWER
ncbi:MAG TPA: hypothetical protein VFU46_04095 [Gemmatimonadales bacterium]|nr:hypothetical protein [Gemmatimonadales bacterium]